MTVINVYRSLGFVSLLVNLVVSEEHAFTFMVVVLALHLLYISFYFLDFFTRVMDTTRLASDYEVEDGGVGIKHHSTFKDLASTLTLAHATLYCLVKKISCMTEET